MPAMEIGAISLLIHPPMRFFTICPFIKADFGITSRTVYDNFGKPAVW